MIKYTGKDVWFIAIMIFLCSSSIFASNNRCPPKCYYYYGYNFPASMYDYEVDNACVDFCIDKRHKLQECMRACSNYTRPIDYPP